MSKKLSRLIVGILMIVCSIFACTGCAEGMITTGLKYQETGYYYKLSGIGEVTSPYINVPKMYIGRHVTVVGMEALSGTSVKSVKLPDSILTIQPKAFADCAKLKKMVIPKYCEFIGYEAFAGCTSLSTITFANPYGWYERVIGQDTSTLVDLSDPATNATYLKNLPADKYLAKGN